MKKLQLIMLFLAGTTFGQQGAIKLYLPAWGIKQFKVIETNNPMYKFIGLTTDVPFSTPESFVGNSYPTIAYYDFQKDTVVIIGTEGCNYASCHGGDVLVNCSGIKWMDIAPFQTTRDLVSTWEEDQCPTWWAQYSITANGCQIQKKSGYSPDDFPSIPFTAQTVFFHPTDSTILYQFDSTQGLLTSHFTDCPQNWQVIKAAKNPSYLSIPYDHTSVMLFTADDTLWHSNDAGTTWDMSVAANINTVACYPQLNIFIASSSDSLSKGLYRSLDSGKTFVLMDTIRFYSVAVDTTNGAIYAGTDGALLRSDDTGKTFYIYNNTFTKNPVFSVTANVYGKLICAASDGLYNITGEAAGIEQNVLVHDNLLKNYPNPFTSSTLIRIPSQSQAVSLKIYDALGREVADLSAEVRNGNTSIPFDGSRLPAGVYVCRMLAGETISQRFMTVVK